MYASKVTNHQEVMKLVGKETRRSPTHGACLFQPICSQPLSHTSMSLFVDDGESYPGISLSVSQLLDAAKRKLQSSTFGDGCVGKP